MEAALPRGPGGTMLSQVWRWVYHPAETLDSCSARYGDWFTLRLRPGLDVVFTSSPEAAKDVFAGDPDKLHAGEGNAILKPLLGRRSVLVLDGPEHRRVRRLMMPPFHGDRMKAYGAAIGEIAARHIERWPRGRRFELHPALQAVTLDVILATVFGLTEGERLARLRAKLTQLLNSHQSATEMLLSILLLDRDGVPPFAQAQERLGWTPWGRFMRLRREIDAILYEEIADRRARDARGREDVLSLLIAARDQDGRALDDEEVRDEMVTLLVAGHETSATALSSLFLRLASEPAVAERIRKEGGEYLDAAINESLRLDPVVPFVWRLLKAPMRLGGRDLPAGAAIAVAIYLLHRSPKLWKDPLLFNPDRFMNARPAAWEFLPFGGGGRKCLGLPFALYEMRVVVASVLARLDLSPVPGYRPKHVRRGITLAPSEEAPVLLSPRS